MLCDSCDNGYHASCLRPALMVIPEGDWFCPACNHKKLLSSLTDKLSELDTLLKKTEAERRRKERLAFIQKGLSKSLPTAQKKDEKKEPEFSSDESSSDTDSEDEVLLPRKCRTKNPVTYNTEEYDQMMNKALQGDLKYQKKDAAPAISDESEDESDKDEEERASPGKPKPGQGKGKNIDNQSDESEDSEDSESEAEKKPKPLKMSINKMKKGGKKKRKRLTNFSSDESGDGDSGSDFKLSDEASDEEEFIDDGSDSESDEYNYRGKKKGRGGGEPSRRSTRSRRNRLDDDFVVDGSDSEDYAPKKKKSKWASDSEESERYLEFFLLFLPNIKSTKTSIFLIW